MPALHTKGKTGAPAIGGQVVIEWAEGRLEELTDVRQEFDLLIHDGTRQAFPVRDLVPCYTLSLDGPYSMFEAEVHYYDDELSDPDADQDFVYWVAEAACIAAERGELQEDRSQTYRATMNAIGAIGGVVFPILAAVLAVSANNGLSISWFGS